MTSKILRIIIGIIFYVCAEFLLKIYGLEAFDVIPMIILILLMPNVLSDETIEKVVKKVVGCFFRHKK
jgi:hypothetical protein